MTAMYRLWGEPRREVAIVAASEMPSHAGRHLRGRQKYAPAFSAASGGRRVPAGAAAKRRHACRRRLNDIIL